MSDFGITQAGFVKKDAPTQKAIIEEKWLNAWPDADISSKGDGVIIGIVGDLLSELWDIAEGSYYAPYPDTAFGASLVNSVSLVGVSPIKARYSICLGVTVENSSEEPITILAGSLVKQSTTGIEWQTLTDVTIDPEDTNTVDVICTQTGPFSAAIGSIDTIVNPISGWESVTNSAIAVPGRDAESDPELRTRRNQSVVTSRGGIVEAIANRVLTEVPDVVYTSWRENRTSSTNGDGLPPKSFEIIVDGGDETAVAEKIAESAPAGIESYGSTTVSGIIGENGIAQDWKYSKITQVPIYLVVNITDSADYPDDGDDLVKAALVAYGRTIERNETVRNWKFLASLLPIPGIDAVTIFQGTAPAPGTSVDISISANQRATITDINITVNT
jgi:hypothetical protein